MNLGRYLLVFAFNFKCKAHLSRSLQCTSPKGVNIDTAIANNYIIYENICLYGMLDSLREYCPFPLAITAYSSVPRLSPLGRFHQTLCSMLGPTPRCAILNVYLQSNLCENISHPFHRSIALIHTYQCISDSILATYFR